MGREDAFAPTVAAGGEDPLAQTLTTMRDSVGAPATEREPEPTGAARYERREEIGRGGMGVVWRAVDAQFARDVALKEMRPELTGANHAERFATECLITGNLEHPGVPAVYERGMVDDTPFYTMRRVSGRSMKDALLQAASMNDRLAMVPALTGVAQTLAYAHSRGVVHRDIKPSNIVLGDYGETFVLDWGIAKIRGVTNTTSSGISGSTDNDETLAGSVIGTPSYMSPEQAEGRVDATDERSDVFALGALLYHILTGQAPYRGENIAQRLDKAQRCDFEPIQRAAPNAPRSLRAICERAMARSRADRFHTAGEFAGALEQFTANAVVHQDAGPVGWIARAVTVLSALLAASAVAVFATMLPRFAEFGVGAYPILGFTAIGVTLSILEYATKGRYALGPLILAMAAATFVAGILALSTGTDHILGKATVQEVFDDPYEFRAILAVGTKELIGNMTLAGTFTIAQMFAWAIARRRSQRS